MKETTLCYIENNGCYLMMHRTKKQNDPNEGKWIGIGGKIEAGETPKMALKREIHEELDAEIEVGELLRTIDYDYPNFHLTMHCFICELISEDIVLKEHSAAKWLDKAGLDTVDWLPADRDLISKIENVL